MILCHSFGLIMDMKEGKKMNTLQIIFLQFVRNKYIFIPTIVAYFFLNLYLILSLQYASFSDINYLSITLMLTEIFLPFFLFISYEFFYKYQQRGINEIVFSSLKGYFSISKNQFLVMLTIAVIFYVTALFYNIAVYYQQAINHLEYFVHIFLSISLNLFGVSLAGMCIGFVISFKFKRLQAYLVLAIFTVLSSQFFGKIAHSTNLYNIFELFNFQHYLDFTPNHSFGFSLLDYRWARVSFWVFLSLFFVARYIFKNKITKRVFSLLMAFICIISFITMVTPTSKVDMNEHYQLKEIEYYERINQKNKEANFEVLKYELDLEINRNLKAKATMELSDNTLTKYIFTLYHGYEIKYITDQNGNQLDYDIYGDYITIHKNETPIEKIIMEYQGSCSTFYSNYQGIYLSGAFPYYPKAGFHVLYNIEYQNYNYILSNYLADYHIKVEGLKKTYSNLFESSINTFEGKSNGVSLVNGFYDVIDINGVRVIYPYLATEFLDIDLIASETLQLINNPKFKSSSIKTIICIPNMNNYDYSPIYSDHIEMFGIYGINHKYNMFIMNKNKRIFYQISLLYYTEEPELFTTFLVDDESVEGESKMIAKLTLEMVEKFGETEALNRIRKFIFENEDTRTPLEFFEEQLSGG